MIKFSKWRFDNEKRKTKVMMNKLSVLWFIFLMYGYGNGMDISDLNLLMIAVFYIGDCILLTRKRDNK